ncbi:protease Do-like 8, chloroplastic isoform X3 [Actinidia eriantha]|uniref:protease Do-like 8, chloroplastic isoform X3 n=1 Tax=Actinidia eriantha TaxID=165200 RepID=UPI00258E2574|nr:protease Do-like 8, chloroplastic isoform X3 [Actinidia eriantha]
MQLIACNSCSSHLLQRIRVPTRTRRCLGRRELCFNGVSLVCSPSEPHLHDSLNGQNDSVSSHPSFTTRTGRYQNHRKYLVEVVQKNFPFTTRRMLFASLFMYSCYHPSRYLLAHALGDPSVTIEDVTSPTYPSGALFPSEVHFQLNRSTVSLFLSDCFICQFTTPSVFDFYGGVIDLCLLGRKGLYNSEKNTSSVVNIFDVTFRPQLNVTGVVEIPEGNGSGVVWDGQGHIVTNYHVIGNSLLRNPSRGQVVARFNTLASEWVQKNFEGKLIGADHAKDLAVLKVPRNSLAAKAGILPTTRAFAGNIVLGDIIVAVDNKPVRSKAELYKAFDDYNVGEKVLFKIQRGNENLEMPVVLEEKDSR